MRTNAKKDGSDWILNGNKVLSHKSKNGHFIASQHPFELFFRVSSPGVHHKRLDVRPGGGGGRDEPRGEDGGTRHQSVPGGERHEGLPERTQVGEDRSEGPGTGAQWLGKTVFPSVHHPARGRAKG